MADSRVRFLTEGAPDAPDRRSVRGAILASWQRSSDFSVAADRIERHYVRDLEWDTPLTRSAGPVLGSLKQQLDGQSVSVILTDPSGLVLTRLTGDSELERHLDRVFLAPGFSYAEKFVGTNGIGTALEVDGPAHVFGHEHYAENLEELACAGVPIHHPISGRLVGAVDLTCWRKDAGALLLTLAKATANQIRHALLTEEGAVQRALFEEYRKACNRRAGVVIALSSDTVMVNEHARAVLDPADQDALLTHATEVLVSGSTRTVAMELPTGVTARMYCQLVRHGDLRAGLVARVKLGPMTVRHSGSGSGAVPSLPLPGLVGTGPAWLHACTEAERTFRAGEWLAVEGEPGVGKLALLRAVQLRRQPVGRFTVVDATDPAAASELTGEVARAVAQGAGTVVIRHVDRLEGPALRSLASALRQQHVPGPDAPWVAVTMGHGARSKDLANLLDLFPSTLDVPPLRMHLEDLDALVPLFLSRLARGGQLVCSPETLRQLKRASWPGNTEQLHQTLRRVATHRRHGTIEPDDLPPEVHSVSHRVLSSLESMERDAIVQALGDAQGNKARAAGALGMSRATIYRKIREYGILLQPG